MSNKQYTPITIEGEQWIQAVNRYTKSFEPYDGEFVDIPGYDGYYRISRNGEVKSYWKSKVAKLKAHKDIVNGYLYYCLKKPGSPNGVAKQAKVHKILMLTFVGESDLYVNHINGIKDDNRLENLEYVNYRDNCLHKRQNSTKKYHSKYPGVVRKKMKYGIRWCARAMINGRHICKGSYKTDLEAHQRFLQLLKEYNIECKYATL